MVTIPLPAPSDDKIRFDKSVSLGSILQIAVLIAMISMAWSSEAERVSVFEQRQQEQQKQIQDLSSRMAMISEDGAREAALLDGIEMRVNRLERDQDRRK